MELSNNVVSQFVKITNDDKRKEDNTKAQGTVVIYNDEKYVLLDGSDLLTPVDTTVHVKDNERVTVTIKDHNAIIDGNITDISASNEHLEKVENDLVDFKITTEGMFVTVRDEFNTRFSRFEITVNGMIAEVRNEMEQKFAKIEIEQDKIQSEVGAIVDGSSIGTVVVQNATSWGLSINGKLYGTNYRFDGTNFTIGSSTGGTTAYHAAGYSKWTHSDGSWTRVDSNGMTWSKGTTSTKYHCLLYAGEYTCASEETMTIRLPDEFKGKPFKVVTSIKRIYVSNTSYVTGAYFPLLSFYAEALNVNHSAGTFQVYASIRAWNRTGYSNWGTMIGNGAAGTGEREALKPVVAYWAFV